MSKTKTHNSKFIIISRWLISLLVLAVLLWFLYIYAGKLLCHIAIRQIGELTNTRISAGSIIYQSNGSVVIDDLVISPIKRQQANAAILKAKKVRETARMQKASKENRIASSFSRPVIRPLEILPDCLILASLGLC